MQPYKVTCMPAAGLHLTVPQELQAIPQWVTWKLINNPKKPKPDKVPYNANTGKMASSTDPTSWATFNEAVAAYTGGGYSGIGFVLTPECGIVGVDLDNAVDDEDNLEGWAEGWIAHFKSYTEYSPSGHGFRIFIQATKHSKRCKTGDIEVYDSGRFLTVTGNAVLTPYPVNERQAELDAFMLAVFGDRPEEYEAEPDTEARPRATEKPYTGSFNIDPNAEPPFKKWATLRQLTPQAGRYFDHKGKMPKTKEGADDLSAIELALANFAIGTGWNDQETVDLLIAHRQLWGERPKHRRYYELTLIAAHDRDLRQGVLSGTHSPKSPAVAPVPPLQALDAAEPGEVPPDGSDEGYSLDEDPPELLGPEGLISAALGIEITEILKFDSQPPTYQIIAKKDGITKTVRLGKVGMLIQQGYLREAIATIDHYIPPVHKDQWPTVAQWLLNACTLVGVGDEAQEIGSTHALLNSYLSSKRIKDDFDKALSTKSPFREDGVLCIFGSDLRAYAVTVFKESISPQEFGAKMRLIGASPLRVSVPRSGAAPSQVQVWRLPTEY